MVRFRISSLFFLIFITVFLFFHNEKIIKKIEDLNSLENLIFQNGKLIENIGALEEYIGGVVSDKTIKNYEILGTIILKKNGTKNRCKDMLGEIVMIDAYLA